MSLFARQPRIVTSFLSFAFAAIAFTNGCAVEQSELDTQPVASDGSAQRIDTHGEVLDVAKARPHLALNRDVVAAVLAEEKNPALVAKREECVLQTRHWSVLEQTCMDPDSVQALADRCRFDGGVMKDGGCTFSGLPVDAPTTVDEPVKAEQPGKSASHPPICTQVDITGACKVALPHAPVAVGCAKPPCE